MSASIENYFLFLNYSPTHLIDQMKTEASVSENYYLSPVGVSRCDVSAGLRNELTKVINVPFEDCGFLKTAPGQIYPPHVDAFRVAAINMPLYPAPNGFKTFVMVKGKGVVKVDYTPEFFTLLNVMNIHGVENKNPNEERVMLSIGIKDFSYNELEEMHNAGNLLNAIL